MSFALNWFQTGPVPADALHGSYNASLVFLSYVIACFASYIALDLAGHVRIEGNSQIRRWWIWGGAFAMGAGIWSMHFIGMLAFVLPMPMNYEFSWTALSLLSAILSSALALYMLGYRSSMNYLILGGILMGLGIANMHYMGMTAMTHEMEIRYLPSLFFISILIAVVASEAALWLAIKTNNVSPGKQIPLKVIAALIMGAAICGMHYTGMAAAVFTPLHMDMTQTKIPPTMLAFFIAGITALIIALMLTVSIYYRMLANAIKAEREFLNTMILNLEETIVACNSEGNITVINKKLDGSHNTTLQTYPAQTLENHFNFYYPDSMQLVSSEDLPLKRALLGEKIHDLNLVLQLKDGTNRDVIINGQPIYTSAGKKLGAVIVIHDVTELKNAERLKTEFVSVVSHELRTPLTSIRGSISLILSGITGEISDRMLKLLQIANNNTERLTRLINDILDIEKIEAGKMNFFFQEIDLVQLVKDAHIEIKAIADKAKVEIDVNSSSPKLELKGDYDRLMQVIVNLLSNAIRFSSSGQHIEVSITPRGRWVRVSVSDHGSGIPEDFQSHIFQKFSQADSSSSRHKGGTGLGLSISKAIIEKHGGNIQFQSKPNEGTTFYFDLPYLHVKAEKPLEKSDPLQNAKLKMLICDSNPDSASFLHKFLRHYHIDSDIALSAHEARDLLEKNRYNAMAMDLILIDMSGIKFINELRENSKTSHLPIVVISTIAESGKQELNGNGFPIIDWIDKPADPKELKKVVNYIRTHFQHMQPKILCVEDDKDITKLLELLLHNEARLWVAPDLTAARQLLASEAFDLLILDLRLPDGLGTDLLPCINIQTHHVIPVIVFSAYELDKKYTHLVKASLLKSKVNNEKLIEIIHSVMKTETPEII